MNILAKFLKKSSITAKMKNMLQYIYDIAVDMDKRNESEVVEKKSVKELSDWYSKRVKEYEKIIDEAEQKAGLRSVCEKGCGACCNQAIYINPAEYKIIEKYIEQLGYTEKAELKKQVREALDILEQVDIPMKVVDGDQKEQDRINKLFFSCNIRCPFLSQDNECKIYEIRPCVCWSYRNYKDKSECKECFNPRHSCAFVNLDLVMTKEMYNHGQKVMKHKEYYLLIYAIGKMLFMY